MKRRGRFIFAALLIVFVAAGVIFRHRPPVHSGYAAGDREGSRPDTTAAPPEQKPVGWVFGRLMGFPGADRPLTTTVGPANRPPLRPPSAPGSNRGR
jgi:hypothetical protein